MMDKKWRRPRGPPVEKIVPFSQKYGILKVRFSRAERWAVRMADGIVNIYRPSVDTDGTLSIC